MFEGKDLEQIKAKGITEEQINWQMGVFKKGVPFVKLNRAATIDDGIVRIDEARKKELTRRYDEASGISRMKFVPASGAKGDSDEGS